MITGKYSRVCGFLFYDVFDCLLWNCKGYKAKRLKKSVNSINWLGIDFNFTNGFACGGKFYSLFIMLLSTVNFTTYFFKDFPKAEVVANQLPGYTINFEDSKLFMEHLNELHVNRYYGVPIYNQNQPNGNVELLCIEHPSPYKLNQFEEKY